MSGAAAGGGAARGSALRFAQEIPRGKVYLFASHMCIPKLGRERLVFGVFLYLVQPRWSLRTEFLAS